MKYIGFYDTLKNRRSMSLAAVNKMNYICSALNKNGKKVDIIACGMIAQEKIEKGTEKISDKTLVHFFKTMKRNEIKAFRIIQLILQNYVLLKYLITHTKRKEKVLVYHSLGLMRVVYWAKKIKHFQLFLEVEEVYNDVQLQSKASSKMEMKFFDSADGYIFPTQLLNKKFNETNKPSVIIHGTYNVEHDRRVSFGDNKIHIVYAGTFDPRKGGAAAAIAAAEYLSENYHVHIIGFGSDKDVEHIRKVIDETNSKSKASVTYDGLLSGEDYIQFLQKCKIGLSTQDPNADFNETSFPSKILSYMANGLRVVTVRIPAIEESAISQDVYYYDRQTPTAIAEAIMKIDFNDGYDGRKRIKELDKSFRMQLKNLLEKTTK